MLAAQSINTENYLLVSFLQAEPDSKQLEINIHSKPFPAKKKEIIIIIIFILFLKEEISFPEFTGIFVTGKGYAVVKMQWLCCSIIQLQLQYSLLKFDDIYDLAGTYDDNEEKATVGLTINIPAKNLSGRVIRLTRALS